MSKPEPLTRRQAEGVDVSTIPNAARACCVSCGAGRLLEVLSLGHLPLANAFPLADDSREEPRFPLDLAFCPACSLVQLQQVVPPDLLFSEYLYFSSYSSSMLKHAEALADEIVAGRKLSSESLVVEVASNDGYLLQFFRKSGVGVLGIEPAGNIVRVAEDERGIPTLHAFFDDRLARDLAAQGRSADVVVCLNVLAHVPDPNDFVSGIARMLKPDGVAVIEVPYVRDMVDRIEFDTIYHEHRCYFSVHAAAALARRHGLVLQDVRRVPIHGGSLRLFIGRGADHGATARQLLEEEQACGLDREDYYRSFRQGVENVRTNLRATLCKLREDGARIAAYGAAAKGTVLLNYCAVGADAVAFVADRNPHKQGRRMPGCGIPIVSPEMIMASKPDYLLILVWNLKEEILRQEQDYRRQGGRFIVPIPAVEVL